jgi:PAS domain S-box-containing protein
MTEKFRILLVEDNEADQMAFERLVERKNLPYDYVIAGSIAGAKTILATERFDALVTDHVLEDGTAFDLFGEVEGVPVVVIIESGDEEIAVKAIQAGATDCLLKNPDGDYPSTLPVTVERAIRFRQTKDELNRALRATRALQKAHDELKMRVERRTVELAQADEALHVEIAESIAFEDLFNLDDIQRLQDEFARAAGVSSIITHPDGTPITAPSNFCRLCRDIIRKTGKGLANCFKSDAAMGRVNPEGPTIQPCLSGGLWHAGTSITVGGKHIANWLIGQVRDETQSEEKMRQYAREIGADEDTVAEAFYQVSSMSREQFGQVAQVLFTFANQLSTTAYQNVQQARFIAEHKRMEQALRDSEAHYRALFEYLPIPAFTKDRDGRYTSCNAENHRYWSVSPIGHTDAELLPPEVAAALRAVDLRVMETEDALTQEEYLANTPMGDRQVISRKVPLRDGSGDIVGILGAGLDITERRQMEQQLRKQERLAAVGQLAAGIAHDFRNLLTTITLYASMALYRPDLPPNLAPNMHSILGESNKAADLVQQILDFSSRSTLRVQVLDPQSLVQNIVGILKRTIPENVRLSLEVEPGEHWTTCTVRADPGRIQQALTNLATNAHDAMPRGGELRLRLSHVEVTADKAPPVADMEPGAWVCLAVSDTGTGMTEQVRAHLFEPFFTTKEVDKGTGLGLAQVYGIVRQHEGHIDVETELGRGTTFRIYLPAYTKKVKETEVEEPSALPLGQGETILLVEDDENLREAGQSLLESLDYRVLAAANGREALAIYEAGEKVDLLITDMVMPEMGGRELVREMRSRDLNLKALGITGYAIEEATEELRKVGFLEVIHKPFEIEVLAQMIHRALNVKAIVHPTT